MKIKCTCNSNICFNERLDFKLDEFFVYGLLFTYVFIVCVYFAKILLEIVSKSRNPAKYKNEFSRVK